MRPTTLRNTRQRRSGPWRRCLGVQMGDKGMPSRQDYQTPPELFAALHREFGFTVDVAASDKNHLCDHYFTAERSGLDSRWDARIGLQRPWAFVQPPYNDVRSWLDKAVYELSYGIGSTHLIPAAVENQYWQKYIVGHAAEVRLVVGRIPFIDPTTGKPAKGNRGNSSIVVFRPHWPGDRPHVHWIEQYWRVKCP